MRRTNELQTNCNLPRAWKKLIRFRLLCYSILRHLPSHSIWYVCWRETAEPENCHDAWRATAEPLATIRVGQQNYTGSRIKMAVAEKCSSSWLKHDVFMSPADVIDTTRRVCGRVYVTVRCPSFLVIERCGSVRRVCCCGPAGCRISIDCWATSAQQQRRCSSTAGSSKGEQCHVYSRRRRLNTDWFAEQMKISTNIQRRAVSRRWSSVFSGLVSCYCKLSDYR